MSSYYENRKKEEQIERDRLKAAAENIYILILASLTARGMNATPRAVPGWPGSFSLFMDHDTIVSIGPHKEYHQFHSTLTGKINISFQPSYKSKTRVSNIKVDPNKFNLEATVLKILARQGVVNEEMAAKTAHEDKFALMRGTVDTLRCVNDNPDITVRGNSAALTSTITVTCKSPEELGRVYALVAGNDWRDK